MRSVGCGIAVAVALALGVSACTEDEPERDPIEINGSETTDPDAFDPTVLPERPEDEESEFGSYRFAEHVRIVDAESGETVEELDEGEPRDLAVVMQWHDDQWRLLDLTTHQLGELEGVR